MSFLLVSQVRLLGENWVRTPNSSQAELAKPDFLQSCLELDIVYSNYPGEYFGRDSEVDIL